MSKDTARQEVEKVCFAFEKAGKTGNQKDWGKFYDLEEPLIKKVEFANQPKLSIPKKIAEEVDEFAHTNWANWQFYFYSDEMSEDLIDWLDNGDSEFTNAKIALAYLNPLTRPFVEVTDE